MVRWLHWSLQRKLVHSHSGVPRQVAGLPYLAQAGLQKPPWASHRQSLDVAQPAWVLWRRRHWILHARALVS